MISRRRARFLVLLVFAWFYGALLFLYPKSFRLRYSAELRRDFFNLSREALREGGVLGVARVWAQAFSALVLTAIRQRSITSPSLPMERRVASAVVMMAQVVLIAIVVAMVSFWQAPPYEAPRLVSEHKQPGQAPTYQASGAIWLTEKPNSNRVRVQNAGAGGYFLRPPGVPEQIETIREATLSRPVAKEVIRRLDLRKKPAELLDNLAVETGMQIIGLTPSQENWDAAELTYTDTDPQRAERIRDAVGRVAFEGSNRIGYTKSSIPERPGVPPPSKSALRNGLLTLAVGLVLCLILKRREFMYVLSNRGAVRDAIYYLWETRYAYYLSLGQTISAKATVAVRLFVAVALSVASLVGGGRSKPAPFD